MKKTNNFSLNQWDPTDRILREDFNRDNKTIDAALAPLRDLDAAALGEGGLGAALAGKLGHMELLRLSTSIGKSTECLTSFPVLDWDKYEYAAALVSFPGMRPGDSPDFTFKLNPSSNKPEHDFGALPQPGLLMVLPCMHNGGANCAGFLITNRLIPFSCDFPYRELHSLRFRVDSLVTMPFVAFLGGK